MNGPRIHLVALPIGNWEDLSPRARHTLERAHRIFCEDTRKLRDLAARAGMSLSARLLPMPGDREHEFDWAHEAESAAPQEEWAFVSDAGTPVVNDPGRALLDFANRKGWSVVAVPGPSAPVAAWQWSGGYGLPFTFAGFAPKAKQAGAAELDEFFARAPNGGTFCFFDTRHQAHVTLAHLVKIGWGERRLCVAREMTKTHEELFRGTVDSACTEFLARRERDDPMGELTLVLDSPARAAAGSATVASLSDLLTLRHSGPKQAAKVLARLTGLSTSDAYSRLIAAKGATHED